MKMKIITIIIYLLKNVRFANNDKMNTNEIQEKFSNFMKNKQTNKQTSQLELEAKSALPAASDSEARESRVNVITCSVRFYA